MIAVRRPADETVKRPIAAVSTYATSEEQSVDAGRLYRYLSRG
jgi:hypothetical protein